MFRLDRRRPHTPNRAAGNTIRIPLRMPHVILGVGEVVIQQLGGLGLLQRQVVFHDDALHEVLVDDFTVPLPRLAVVRDQHVVATRDQVVRHVAVRPVAVDT